MNRCGLPDLTRNGVRPCPGEPFARWFYDASGFEVILCQRDLDLWLDNADEEPELEPSRLEFLR